MKTRILSLVALVLLFTVTTTFGIGMSYDAGSDTGKGGLPDATGSIVDNGSGSTFFYYDNIGATEALSADSFDVTMGAATSDWQNSYSQVYLTGTHDVGPANHPVTDLGFDVRDVAETYTLSLRMRIDSFDVPSGGRATSW